MKRILIALVLALFINLICNIKVFASDVTPSLIPSSTPTPIVKNYDVLNTNVAYVDLNSAYYYYSEVLNSDQKAVAIYLVGSYNYMYLRSRGFNYNNITNENEFIDHINDFGSYFFRDGFKNASRYNATFQKYLVAIINYAGTVNTDFSTWLNNNTDDFYIPYTLDSLNAWTQFYNDPSSEGIVNFGYEVSPWVSGILYNFEYNNYSWRFSDEAERWNSEVLDYSPGIYSNIYSYRNMNMQSFISLKEERIIDTLYILRGNNGYQFYRFGYSDKTYPTGFVMFRKYAPTCYIDGGVLRYTNQPFSWNGNIQNVGSLISFEEIVDIAFNKTPINGSGFTDFKGFYPYIEHVILVDDLSTLSNATEVTNAKDLNVNGDGRWIQTPNGVILLFPSKGDRVWELDPYEFLKKEDPNGSDPAPIDIEDLQQQIVNNTVINNYDIVAPGVIINVPVDWLDGEENYLEYTNNMALPFFVMVGDIFNALGEIRIFIIAVLIIGLAGGVLVKFLL